MMDQCAYKKRSQRAYVYASSLFLPLEDTERRRLSVVQEESVHYEPTMYTFLRLPAFGTVRK